MNKKGQGFFFLLMIGVVMFILGFALAKPLISTSSDVRTNMNCSNTSLSTDQKVNCGVVDIISPWFVGLVLGLGGMVITSKLTE